MKIGSESVVWATFTVFKFPVEMIESDKRQRDESKCRLVADSSAC